jgi:hypothetical protein
MKEIAVGAYKVRIRQESITIISDDTLVYIPLAQWYQVLFNKPDRAMFCFHDGAFYLNATEEDLAILKQELLK